MSKTLPDRLESAEAVVAGSSRSEAMLVDLARDMLAEKVRARRWKIFFRFLLVAFLLALLLLPLLGSLSGLGSSERHAAVVDIKGVISEGSPANANDIVRSLEAAFKDSRTEGVILRINSPGGSPVQSGIVFDEILRLRGMHPDTPLYAVVADTCASGGYYIAAAADKIYADRASIVGSIGVRLDSFGFVDAFDKLGVERRLITAGENKALLDPFLPENPGHREHLQQLADSVHEQFIDAVKRGRGERLADDDSLFSGLFWTGQEALELGLVDELSNERAVAEDVLGVNKRVNFTIRQSPVEKLLNQVRLQFSLFFSESRYPAYF